MLEPSLHRRRHTVLDVSCRVRLSSYSFLHFAVSCNQQILNILLLALITRPPDGVLLAPLALAAGRLASLRELLPVVRTEFHNRLPDVASPVLRT